MEYNYYSAKFMYAFYMHQHIIPEEGMTMKSPPGSISPPAECRDQLQIGPRTRVFGDGASGSSFWKIMAASTFLGF